MAKALPDDLTLTDFLCEHVIERIFLNGEEVDPDEIPRLQFSEIEQAIVGLPPNGIGS